MGEWGFLLKWNNGLMNWVLSSGFGFWSVLFYGNINLLLVTIHNKHLIQNWYEQGESDCLIKTKHCDGP